MLSARWLPGEALMVGVLAFMPMIPTTALCSDSSYFPLKLGNQWTYRGTMPDGKKTSITETVVDTARVEGELYFVFDPRNSVSPVFLRSSGVRIYAVHPPDTASSLYYDFGADSGASWTFPGRGTMTVRSVDDTVVVPAGVFSGCRLIESFLGIDAVTLEWFARGIGVVKREVITIAGATVWELTNTVSAVEVRQREVPVFSLSQNFPNPFNPTTTIRFSVGEASHVHLRLFDMLGRTLETLLDQVVPAGSHELIWNAQSLPSGAYFCRLQVGGSSLTKELLLIR